MKKSKLKIMLILSVFLALAMILCIFIFKNPKDKQEYNIDKKEAQYGKEVRPMDIKV